MCATGRPSVARSAHGDQGRSLAPAAVWSPRTPARSARRPQGEDGGSEGASPSERSEDQLAQLYAEDGLLVGAVDEHVGEVALDGRGETDVPAGLFGEQPFVLDDL